MLHSIFSYLKNFHQQVLQNIIFIRLKSIDQKSIVLHNKNIKASNINIRSFHFHFHLHTS